MGNCPQEREAVLNVTVQTDRLRIRMVKGSDTPGLVRLNADADVMLHIGQPFTVAQSLAWVERFRDDYIDRRYGWYAVDELESRECIGLAAFRPLGMANRMALGDVIAGCTDDQLVEVGWRFHKSFWGKGYATESGRALVKRGFEVLDLSRVIAVALQANKASCAAIEKVGLKAYADYTIEGRAARMFVLNREDYVD